MLNKKNEEKRRFWTILGQGPFFSQILKKQLKKRALLDHNWAETILEPYAEQTIGENDVFGSVMSQGNV